MQVPPASIEPFIHKRMVVLHQEASVMEAARAMCQNGIGCVVVADHEGHITGIVTDRDLACGVLAYADETEAAISDLMSPDPVCVDENASLGHVTRLMEENGIRRVPVVTRSQRNRQKCVGIITLDDLIAARAIDLQQLSRIVRSQLVRSGRRRTGLAQNAQKAELRSEAHLEQTYNRFFNVVAAKTGLTKEQSVLLGKVVLSALVERLHFTAAASLIAQLPQELQETLLDLPAGPDRRITARALLLAVTERSHLTRESAQRVLRNFWTALTVLVDATELEHVYAQLPKDVARLFEQKSPRAGSAAKFTAQAWAPPRNQPEKR